MYSNIKINNHDIFAKCIIPLPVFSINNSKQIFWEIYLEHLHTCWNIKTTIQRVSYMKSKK